MTEDESRQFDAYMSQGEKLQGEIKAGKEASEKALHRKSLLESSEASLKESRGRIIMPGQVGGATNFQPVYRGRKIKLTADQVRRASEDYRAGFNAYLADLNNSGNFSAALQTDIAEKGGYLAPVDMLAEVLKTIDNTFWFRQLANVLPPTSAKSISWPKRTARMSRFVWGQELATPTADTALKVGGRSMTPHWMSGEIDVSNDLIMSAIVDIDQFVTTEIAWASGDTEEAAFFAGDGVGKPVGVFVNHPNGITTGRDTSGGIDHDSLVNTKYSLREPYLRDPSLRWVGSRQFYRDCMKLKSTTNEPIYIVTLREGQPDTLLGTPTVMSEYAPVGTGASNAWQTGDYQAAIAAWKNYDIIDGTDMGIQRDISLMARQNQTVYIVRRKVDGCPRFEEAFARLKKS